MYQVVLFRHGESQWNLDNRFTGWVDVELTPNGRNEAKRAGQLLKEAGFEFDVAYTSVLKRAIHTLWGVLEEMDQAYIPVIPDWRLNERHYGALQGLNKSETAAQYGDEQVLIWRRAYATAPNPLDADSPLNPVLDRRYAHVPKEQLPLTECLKDTVARVVPYWEDTIVPSIRAGKRVVIAAHGNSLRSLVKHLDNIGDDAIVNLNIPTAQPLVYELDADMKPIRSYYLGDADAIAAAVAAVANQAKAK